MLTVLFCFVFPQLYMCLAVRRISKLSIVDNIILSLQLVIQDTNIYLCGLIYSKIMRSSSSWSQTRPLAMSCRAVCMQ